MKKLNAKGFTMPELLIAVAVTTLTIIVLSNYLMQNIQTSTKEATKATLLRELQLTVDGIGNDVRMSANADLHNRNPDNNSPSAPGNTYSWTSDANTVILANAAMTTSRQIIFSDTANYITVKNNIVYFVKNKTLYKRILAAPVTGNAAKTTCPANKVNSACPADKILLNNVSNFTIVYRDGQNNSVAPTNARSLDITISASYNQYKESQSASYTTRMVFRND